MPKEREKHGMTVQEAGRMGGAKRLEQIGPQGMREIGRKGGAHSWTTGAAGARTPHLTEMDRRRAEEIRARRQRGDDLTVEEAGFLGGVERVERAERAATSAGAAEGSP